MCHVTILCAALDPPQLLSSLRVTSCIEEGLTTLLNIDFRRWDLDPPFLHDVVELELCWNSPAKAALSSSSPWTAFRPLPHACPPHRENLVHVSKEDAA